MNNNIIQSECEREIKKVTKTIIILIVLNICPDYAGIGHFSSMVVTFLRCDSHHVRIIFG